MKMALSTYCVFLSAFALQASVGAQAQDRKPAEITRPVGTAPFSGIRSELIALGSKLFQDEKLSTNTMSCHSCHADLAAYSDGFKSPFPHRMGMAADIFAVDKIEAEQAVQLCMLVPMEAKALDWASRDLAALTVYVLEVQKEFLAKK